MTTRRPEQQTHRAVVEHLALRAHPDAFCFHVPLGGWRWQNQPSDLKVASERDSADA